MCFVNEVKYHPNYDKFALTFPSALENKNYNKIDSINELLKHCTIRINGLGTRQVVSLETVDCPIIPVRLDTVAQRILATKNNDEEITSMIKEFYASSDDLLADSNWMTRFLNAVREWLAQQFVKLQGGHTTRQAIENEWDKLNDRALVNKCLYEIENEDIGEIEDGEDIVVEDLGAVDAYVHSSKFRERSEND